MKIVVCEPGKLARIEEIDGTLEAMQKVVEGNIEATYPFKDPVALVCNEDGKAVCGWQNRAIIAEDDSEKIVDVVFGPFFLCGIGEYDFVGLSDELAEEYKERFLYPEKIWLGGRRIKIEQYAPKEE